MEHVTHCAQTRALAQRLKLGNEYQTKRGDGEFLH